MNIYSDYLKEIEERKALGLHPKPIDDSKLLSEIIDQIKDIENQNRKDSLNFFIYNVLPGTTSAARVKAEFLKEIINNYKEFGINTNEDKKKYLIEFVSANPTGPLHIGHAKSAVIGDVIANLLSKYGYHVTKEYYINDYGNQIINFTKSVYFRIRGTVDIELIKLLRG